MTVAVAERGTCDFDVKAGNAEAAGYDAVLIFNNVLGADPRCDAVNLNMSFDGTPAVTIKAMLIPRSIGFEIIDALRPGDLQVHGERPDVDADAGCAPRGRAGRLLRPL